MFIFQKIEEEQEEEQDEEQEEDEQEEEEEEISDKLENQLVIDESEKKESGNEDESLKPADDDKLETDLVLDKNSNVDNNTSTTPDTEDENSQNVEEILNVPPVLSRVELLQHFKTFQKMSDNKFITIGLVRSMTFLNLNFMISISIIAVSYTHLTLPTKA